MRQFLLRCTKYSLEIDLQELFSPVPHGQSEQFSLKSMKEINIPAKNINPCQFITDPLKSSGQPDFSFENESTMCTVVAVISNNCGCMKAVTSQIGWAILQNSY